MTKRLNMKEYIEEYWDFVAEYENKAVNISRK